MAFKVVPPIVGKRLAVVTNAFDPRHFDFDEALLAIAVAVEARRLGWEATLLAATEMQGLASYLPHSINVLSIFGVAFMPFQVEAALKAKATAVAALLEPMGFEAVLAFDPALIAYAAEAPTARTAWPRPHFIAALSQTQIQSRSKQGWFLEDAKPFVAETLALRGMAAADARVAATSTAREFCEAQGVRGVQPFAVNGLYSRLIALAPLEPAVEPAAKGRFVALGNLDGRIGLDTMLDALLAAARVARPVIFAGHCGETPTAHGLSDIARFAARYSGDWSIHEFIDVMKLVSEVRAGDTLIACPTGGLQATPIIAAIRQAGYFGRESGVTNHAFVRQLRNAVEKNAAAPVPGLPEDAMATTLKELLAAVANPIVANAAVVKPPVLETACVFGEGGDIHSQAAIAAMPAFFEEGATAIAPEGVGFPHWSMLSYARGAGPIGALDACLRSSSADYVLVASQMHNPHVDLRRLIDSISRLSAALVLWPLRDANHGTLFPPTLPAELLVDASLSPFVFCVSSQAYRAHVEKLTSTTLAGAVREITLRLALAGKVVRDAPHPVFEITSPDAFVKTRYPFAAYGDAMALADIAAAAVDPAIADAIYLYQGQALRHLQATASAPWFLEANPQPMFSSLRGRADAPPAGALDNPDATRDPAGYLGRIARSEALWPMLNTAGQTRRPLNSRPVAADRFVESREGFVAWAVAEARAVSAAAPLAAAIRSRSASLPDAEQSATLTLVRYALEAAGRQDAARLLT